MSSGKNIAKWGFGMAPISKRMQYRYDIAVQCMLDFLNDNIDIDEIDLIDISELKGMFNRCIRRDQWDWFSVFVELGEPSRKRMTIIVDLLKALRKEIKENNVTTCTQIKHKLITANLTKHLEIYQSKLKENIDEPGAGWVYILSTRENPDILKIGMTKRSVAQRVKEINSATGVLIPYAARQIYRVKNAEYAESEIFKLIDKHRLRSDREFFNLPFIEAVKIIESYLNEEKMRYRYCGTVLWFNKNKCYGFVSTKSHDDIMIHSSQIPKTIIDRIKPGVEIEFELGKRPQGLCALDVSIK